MTREKRSNLIVLMAAATVLMNLYAAGKLRRHRAAEELLKKSEEKFRTIFMRSPSGICVADAQTGRITKLNEKFASLIGRAPAELKIRIGCI